MQRLSLKFVHADKNVWTHLQLLAFFLNEKFNFQWPLFDIFRILCNTKYNVHLFILY